MGKKLVISVLVLVLLFSVTAWDQAASGMMGKGMITEAIPQIVDVVEAGPVSVGQQQEALRPTLSTQGYFVNIRSCPVIDNSACLPVSYLKPGDHAIIIGVDPETGWWQVSWQGQVGWITNSTWLVQVTGETQSVPLIARSDLTPYADDMRVLFEEMTLVQVLSEDYARIESICAGIGLNNVTPWGDGPRVLIPNAGDLAVNGSNVAINLHSNGEITFIPRTQGQRIRVPVDVGNKIAGEEVFSLTFDETMQLMATGNLIWTAKDRGPYANGHGLPGHIAECDPRYAPSYIDAD